MICYLTITLLAFRCCAKQLTTHSKTDTIIPLIKWLKFKGWFILDLPYLLREQKFQNGLELGAKGGRSMYFALKANKTLQLTGIDLWRVMPGSAYRHNDKNEARCRKKLEQFGNRVTLIKGDAEVIADELPDRVFDFIFYDLQCSNMANFHQEMIKRWLPKIRKGGMLIGRDFRNFRTAFYDLGFREADIMRCTIRRRVSERLEFIQVK